MNAVSAQSSILELPQARATIDFARAEIHFADGAHCELSERENQLLKYLFANTGRVVSRDEILTQVWHLDPRRIFTRVIDVHIAHLRSKLKNAGTLKTVYGQGYIFTQE